VIFLFFWSVLDRVVSVVSYFVLLSHSLKKNQSVTTITTQTLLNPLT
ncbi:MAG: hypothetical protein ACI8RD_011848, partial [Bacillariaceae sp.]